MKIVLVLVLLGCTLSAPILETAKQCLECFNSKDQKVCSTPSGLPVCCEADDLTGSCECTKSKGQLWSCESTPLCGGVIELENDSESKSSRNMGKSDSLCIVQFTSQEELSHDLYVTSSGDGTVVHVKNNVMVKESSGSLSSDVNNEAGDEVYYIGINSFNFRATLGRSHGMPIWLIILIVVAVLLVIGGGIVGYKMYQKKQQGTVRQSYSEHQDEEESTVSENRRLLNNSSN